MTLYYLVYYFLIFLCLISSFVALNKGHKRVLPFSILLILTLLVELLADKLSTLKLEFVWAYHIYCPLEYSLICLFLTPEIKITRIKQVVLATVPIFLIFSLLTSILFYQFKTMPGINIEVEGILLACVCTYRMFNLDVNTNSAIYLQSDFWICSGLLIFFGVCSFFFGIYTPLFRLNNKEAFNLFGEIIMPFNLFLYVSILIGILCLLQKKKYTIQ